MTYLIQMYPSCRCVSEARQLFDGVALSGNFQRMHIGDERNGFSRNEHVPVEPNQFVFDFGGCASNGGMPYYIANGPYEDFDSHFSDYGGFQSFVHGVPASFNSHDVNSRLHFQKGTIPALLNTLGLAREATGQVLFIMKKLPQFC